MSLTALRLFGLIRHWKQMFINNTFRPSERQGIEKWLIPRGKDLGDSIRLSRKRNNGNKKNEVRRFAFFWLSTAIHLLTLPRTGRK